MTWRSIWGSSRPLDRYVSFSRSRAVARMIRFPVTLFHQDQAALLGPQRDVEGWYPALAQGVPSHVLPHVLLDSELSVGRGLLLPQHVVLPHVVSLSPPA